MNVFTYMHRSSARFFAALAVFSLLMGLFPFQAFAGNSGAIWTTVGHCDGSEQDTNHYDIGDWVYINGSGFEAGTYDWFIEGQPGKASADPQTKVAQGSAVVDESGEFCVKAYQVAADDDGEYNVEFGDKKDNYRVEGVVTKTGTLAVEKKIEGDTDMALDDFSFTVGGTEYSFDADGKASVQLEVPATYKVVEVDENDGYTTTYSAGCEGEITEAGATCTITNTFEVEPCEDGYIRNEAGQCVPDERPTVDVTLCKVGGTGAKMGGWTLKLGEWEVVTALEGEGKGCAVVSDVPYDEYVVDEVMKSDHWINVAEEGYVTKGATVEVNEQNYLFTLKNRECAEGELVRDNQCVPVEEGNEVITMCKYDDATDEPISGWGMTLTNGTEEGTYELVTGENGCVSQEVDPEMGPWSTIEEDRADWTQEAVYVTGGTVEEGEGNAYCSFFPAIEPVNESLAELSVAVDPTYRCDFYNSEDETEVNACSLTVISDTTNTVTEKGDAAAIVVANQPGAWVGSIANSVAAWIWGDVSGSAIDPQVDETQTFVKTFGWSGPVTSALLDLTADNYYSVKINGNDVATDLDEYNYQTVDSIDVTSFIQPGMNTIEIAVTNKANGAIVLDSNPAGLLYNLTIVGNTEDDCSYTPDDNGGDDLSCQLSVNDNSIRRGDDVVLSWKTNNAVSASLNQEIGDVASGDLPDGSHGVDNVRSDTTYTMTVVDESDATATCSVSVDVRSSGGGGSSTRRTSVEGESDSVPTPQVLGEQVSVVPLGAADAGAGGTAPLTFPSAGLVAIAFLTPRQKHA